MLNINQYGTKFAESGLMVAQTPNDDKLDLLMTDWWLVLERYRPDSIPPGSVFLPGEKLPIDGFGWAPRTFKSAHDTE